MFLGLALFEVLDESGQSETFQIFPKDAPRLVTDRLRDVASLQGADELDLGPLRFYTGDDGLRVVRAASRLRGSSFSRAGEHITFRLSHLGLPIPEGTVGFYGLLLPQGYYGPVRFNLIRTESVWLTDSRQIFITSELTPWEPEWKRGLLIHGDLVEGGEPPADHPRSTSADVFREGISGLHHSQVRRFLRAVNRGLGPDAASVFICHSSADKKSAGQIAKALVGRGIRVWLDEAEIRVGDSLIEKIEKGISKSDRLIVLLSGRSVESRWCQEELRMALAMQIGGKQIKVLPALLEDCEIPGFLKEKAYADFRKDWRFEDSIEDLCDALAAYPPEQQDRDSEGKSLWGKLFGRS